MPKYMTRKVIKKLRGFIAWETIEFLNFNAYSEWAKKVITVISKQSYSCSISHIFLILYSLLRKTTNI